MLWFLRDYPLAALFLRAFTLAFSSLFLGGLFFCTFLLPRTFSWPILDSSGFPRTALRLLRISALGLAITQISFVLLDSAMLAGTAGLPFSSLFTANYFLAGAVLVFTAITFWVASRFRFHRHPVWFLFALPVLGGLVWTSHSASRLDHRGPLMLLTALHQLSVALWIGAMPFLWLLIGRAEQREQGETLQLEQTVRRYSTLAVVCVVVLLASGLSTAWAYTGSWSAVYGTAYGLVLLEKSVLLAALLIFGASNFLLIRKGHLRVPALLRRIARFSEVEIGIGFTIILVAASLSAQAPAVDLTQNRLTPQEIAMRMAPHWPRLATPPFSAMPPVQSVHAAIQQDALSPDDIYAANNKIEQAWSEYNHHWAGIVVFAAGLLALLGEWKRARWARNWPLAFLGLAVFLFFRADPEAWPLGPRGFWASFYNPEDVLHRVCILLLLSFVAFEWGIQTGRLQSKKAALVFPAACALGGALLLTHSHSLGNAKEEVLINMSHAAIAVCGVFAGWSRWLAIRSTQEMHLQQDGRSRLVTAAARTWPVWLMAIGLILLNYRES